MDNPNSDRAIVMGCAGFQSLISMLLLMAVMGNISVEKGYTLGMVSSLAVLISLGIATLVGSAGGNPGIVKLARFLLWLPLLMVMALFVIGAIN